MDVAFNAAASGIAAGMSMLDVAAGNIANAVSSGSLAATSSPASGGAGYGNATGELSSQLPDAFLAALLVKVNAASMRTATAAYSSIGA